MSDKWQNKKVARRKLYSAIVERIEKMIYSGELVPGETLPSERELMDLFGVGRTSVREALFALNRMGLVTLAAGERPRVAAPSTASIVNELAGSARYLLSMPEGARHFQDARSMFECAIARRAAQEATAEQIATLEAALQRNLEAPDIEETVRSDIAFHFAIAAIPGNPILTSVYAALSDWLSEQRITSMQAGQAVDKARAAHRRIFMAIAAHDIEEADRAMRDHLDEVSALYWRARTSVGKTDGRAGVRSRRLKNADGHPTGI